MTVRGHHRAVNPGRIRVGAFLPFAILLWIQSSHLDRVVLSWLTPPLTLETAPTLLGPWISVPGAPRRP
jgi:hypothetical protein